MREQVQNYLHLFLEGTKFHFFSVAGNTQRLSLQGQGMRAGHGEGALQAENKEGKMWEADGSALFFSGTSGLARCPYLLLYLARHSQGAGLGHKQKGKKSGDAPRAKEEACCCTAQAVMPRCFSMQKVCSCAHCLGCSCTGLCMTKHREVICQKLQGSILQRPLREGREGGREASKLRRKVSQALLDLNCVLLGRMEIKPPHRARVGFGCQKVLKVI